jgi:hypothetical protein
MVGYLKFSLIIGLGVFLFDDPINSQQLLSITAVMAGLYSFFDLDIRSKDFLMSFSKIITF